MDQNISGNYYKLNELLAKHKLGLQQKTCRSYEEVNKKLKNLISKHMDFKSLLEETYEYFNIRNPKTESSPPLTDISVSTLQIYLKEQAEITGYQWENIAQNFCCQKIGELIKNESSDVPHIILDQKARENVETIVFLSEELSYTLKEFALYEFTSYIVNQPLLPLDVLWILIAHNFISLEQYLSMIFSSKDKISHLTKGLTFLANGVHKEKELSSAILKDMLGGLVYVGFANTQPNKTQDEQNAVKLSISILDTVVLKLIDFNSSKINITERFNIYQVIAENKFLEVSVLQKFYYQQLLLILSHNPIWKVSQAIKEQNAWCFMKTSPFMKSIFQQLLLALSAEEVISLLQNLIEQHEVNWKSLLTFVSIFVVLFKSASLLLQNLINDILKIGLENKEFEKMIGGFLLARQACLEGPHVFPPYHTWFQVKFGDASRSLAENKKSFLFLISFMSELVPYERAQYLKAHIQNPPYTPSKCRLALNEYLLLAKTRLQDLKELDSNVNEESTEKREMLEQTLSDIKKSLEQFESTGKVSTALIEASIFRKPYFLGRFLPALLTPRLLPEKPDLKMKLIQSLNSMGKIPIQMYQDYENACVKEQQKFKLGLSNFENNSGNLKKSLEDLNVSLSRLKGYITLEAEKTSKIDYITEQISGILDVLKLLVGPTEESDQEIILKIYSPEINLQAAKICDMLLSTFCHILAGSANSEKTNEHSWLLQFTSLFSISSELQKSLYSSLWELLFQQGLSLQQHHIYSLTAILTCLTFSRKLFCPCQIYVGTKENHQIYTDIIEALTEQISVKSRPWMEFCFQLCSYYLQNFYIRHFQFYLEHKESAVVPKNIIQKFVFLYPRFHKSFWSASLMKEEICLPSLLCKDFHGSELIRNFLVDNKLQFKEWLNYEININPMSDFLNEFERQEYLHWFATVYFNGNRCTDISKTFIDIIMQSLLNLPRNRNILAKEEHSQPNSFNQIIHLLQVLVHEFCYQSAAIDSIPWLLNQLMLVSNSELPENVLEDQLHLFFVIAQTLPPYLLFKDKYESEVSENTIDIIIVIINSKLRYILNSEFCLHISVAEYLWKGIFQIETSSNQEIIKKMFEESPIVITSLVYHYRQLEKRLICVNNSGLSGSVFAAVNLCFQWCSNIRQQKEEYQIPQDIKSWIFGLVVLMDFLSSNERKSNLKNSLQVLEKTSNISDISKFVLFFCIAKITSTALQLNVQVDDEPVFNELMQITFRVKYDFTVMDSQFLSTKIIRNMITEDILQFFPVSCLCVLFLLIEHDADILNNSTAVKVLLENYQLFCSLKERTVSFKLLKDTSLLNLEFTLNIQKKFLSYLNKIPRGILFAFPQEIIDSFDPEIKNAILRRRNF